MEHLSFGIVDITVFLAFILLVLSVGFYKSKGEKTHGDNGRQITSLRGVASHGG